jgi:hypothetical protein
VSTGSIVTSPHDIGGAGSCASCGAPLAPDQRYCLQCGERLTGMSSVLRAGSPWRSGEPAPARGAPAASPPAPASAPSSTTALLAGVGVLLLAIGVGVLIGRSIPSKQSVAAPQVVSVASTPAAASTGANSSEPSFSDSWPAGTSGYTVQLQTLPAAGTTVSAVEAATAAAGAKGAKGAGALKSDDFSSLSPGNYVIYAGVYHKRAEADKALRGLKKAFPAASVVAVSKHHAKSSAAASEKRSRGSGVGSSPSHPAPPSVVENLHKTKGQGYEQKSKNLPNVISTG